MAKGDKLTGKQSSKLEKEKLAPLEQLFKNLKQGPSQYADLIRDLETGRYGRISQTADAEYSEAIWQWLGGEGMLYRGEKDDQIKQDWQRMKDKLQGTVLVDLGCGWRLETGGFMYSVVSGTKYPVSAYVGVDRYAWSDIPYNPTLNQYEKAKNREIITAGSPPIGKVHADMLDFVARLPDNSVNFVLNGIDHYVMAGGGEYHKALAREIIRTLKPGGIIFGADFSAIAHELDIDEARKAGLKRVTFPSYMRRDLGAFEKVGPNAESK